MELLREFKPALLFLGKFLAFYFLANIAYGLYVTSYEDRADDATRLVTAQTAWVLDLWGYDVDHENVSGAAKIALRQRGDVVLNVYEGCNGINVIIVFVAFLFAFGGPKKRLIFFLPAGILILHVFNLLRIALLFFLALTDPGDFYYYHKYFFTATLYFVVFVLWSIWVIRFNESRTVEAPG